ncbi:MAG: GNAT family N-acetyltransferase [Pseudomonadota bacterium]
MADAVSFRCASSEDAQPLALFARRTFISAFQGIAPNEDVLAYAEKEHSNHAWEALLAASNVKTIVATDPAGIIGYATVTTPPHDNFAASSYDWELLRLYVEDRAHGRGIGGTLTRQAVDICTDAGAANVFVGVGSHNKNAIAFYRHIGFKDCGERMFRISAQTLIPSVLMKLQLD